MTRARNIAGFSTITTTPSPVHVGPIGVLTATRIDGAFSKVDLTTRELTAQGIGVTNLQISGITTGLNVSGIITAQNGINFNGTSTGLNVSGVGTIATLSVTGNATVGGVLTYEDVTRVDSVGVVTAREQVHVGTGVSIAAGGLNVTAGITTVQALQATTISGTTGTFSSDVSIADKIVHTGDTNTSIRFPAADTFTVETAGSERIRINDNGKELIATDTTSEAHANQDELIIGKRTDDANHGLTIVTPDDRYGTVAFSDGSGGTSQGLLEYNHSGDYFRIYVAGSERIRITSTGLVRIGASTDEDVHTGEGADLQVVSTDGGGLTLARDDTTVSNGANLGVIRAYGNDNNGTYQEVASIQFQADLNHGNSDKPGRLVFSTTADGGSSVTERLRINSSGQLLSGVTGNAGAADANAVFGGGNAGTNNYGKLYITQNQSNPSSGTAIGFIGFSNQDISVPVAFMGVYADADHGSNDYPSRFSFHTTADGSNSSSERLRITKDGAFGLGGANYGSSGQVLTSGGSGSAVSWTTVSGTTINNNANNRIITGSGTANTLEGEVDLTFDGKILQSTNGVGIGSTTVVGRLAGVSTSVGTIQYDVNAHKVVVYTKHLQWQGIHEVGQLPQLGLMGAYNFFMPRPDYSDFSNGEQVRCASTFFSRYDIGGGINQSGDAAQYCTNSGGLDDGPYINYVGRTDPGNHFFYLGYSHANLKYDQVSFSCWYRGDNSVGNGSWYTGTTLLGDVRNSVAGNFGFNSSGKIAMHINNNSAIEYSGSKVVNDNVWHCLGFVSSPTNGGGGSLKLYVDGDLVMTTNNPGYHNSLHLDCVGGNYNYADMVPERMAATAMWNRELTDAEMKQAFHARNFNAMGSDSGPFVIYDNN